jgi:hypothetical protein
VDSCTNQEHAWLQLRVDELEDRVAELEDEIRGLREGDLRPSADRGGDSDREGARLVTIEMLTAGYTRGQIAAYLRHTFAVDDAETLIADAGFVAG